MAKVPTPERGTPLDVTYLYQLANAINDISSQISSTINKYTTVKTREANDVSIKTSEARIVAGFKDVITAATDVIEGNTATFSFDYASDFKYPPIATATPVVLGGTDIGGQVGVFLTSVTTSRVEGFIRYGKTGRITGLTINLIMVGIPA